MPEVKHPVINLEDEPIANLVLEFDKDIGKKLFLGVTDSGKVLGIKRNDDIF